MPNGNHPISSPICPMGVADTLGQSDWSLDTCFVLTGLISAAQKILVTRISSLSLLQNLPGKEGYVSVGWLKNSSGLFRDLA